MRRRILTVGAGGLTALLAITLTSTAAVLRISSAIGIHALLPRSPAAPKT